MEDIVKAIEKLTEKTWVDYLLIILPIAVSMVAVGITVYIAHKQKKIALFEMRYRALLEMKTLLAFEATIYKENSYSTIISAFDMFFGTDVRSQDTIMALMKAAQQMKTIELDIASLTFFVCKKQENVFELFLSCLSKIISDSIGNSDVNREDQENLHIMAGVIRDEVYEKLLKRIKV